MGGILDNLRALWRGKLPLEVAFWHYAIFYGLIVNIIATTVAIALVLADASILLAVGVHLLPVPYSAVTALGVWRSARRFEGPVKFANFCRVGVLVWICFWLAV
ncbi:MAG: hypothetical protein C0484_08390 [Rhodospirillum sp.]|jgi:hypothetical protein|nr:hypothetical protein [Rhodospirillum sp.]